MRVNHQRILLVERVNGLIGTAESILNPSAFLNEQNVNLHDALNNFQMSDFLNEGGDADEFRDRMQSLAASGDDLQASAAEAAAEIDGIIAALTTAGNASSGDGFTHTLEILQKAKADIADAQLGSKWESFKDSVSDFEGIGKIWSSVKDPLQRLAGALGELEALKSSLINSISKTAGYLGTIGIADDSFDTPIAQFSGTGIETSEMKSKDGNPVDPAKIEKLYGVLAKSVQPSEEFGSTWSKFKNAFSFMQKGTTGAFGLDGSQFAAEILSITPNALMDLSDAISGAAPEESKGEGTPAGETADVLSGAQALTQALEDPTPAQRSALGTGGGDKDDKGDDKGDKDDGKDDKDAKGSADLSRADFVATLKPLIRNVVGKPNKFAQALADELNITEDVSTLFGNAIVESSLSLSLLLERKAEIDGARLRALALEYGVSEDEAADALGQLSDILDDEFDIVVTGDTDQADNADLDLPPDVVDVVDDVDDAVPQVEDELQDLPPSQADVLGQVLVDVEIEADKAKDDPEPPDERDEENVLKKIKGAVDDAKATRAEADDLWDEWGPMVTDVWDFFTDKSTADGKDDKGDTGGTHKPPSDEWVKRGKDAGVEFKEDENPRNYKKRVRRAEKKKDIKPDDEPAKKKRVKRTAGDVWKLDEPKSKGRQWAAKGKGGKAKSVNYFKSKKSAEKYALRTEAIRYLRQFGFTLGQLEHAPDNQIFETYQAYDGDVQLLSEVTEQTVYNHDDLVMYRWRKMAGFGD
jgi:hypothetical protein